MSTLTSADFGELKRPTTRVHAPPGGGSNWSFGGDATAPQQRGKGRPAHAAATVMNTPPQTPSHASMAPSSVVTGSSSSAVAASPHSGLRVALLKTKSDAELVDLMVQNCWDKLSQNARVNTETFTVARLDELPYAANKLAQFGGFGGVICFGFLNVMDPLFGALSASLTRSFIDISVKNVKPVVRGIFIGEPRVASVKAKGGYGAEFAESIDSLISLGGFVGPASANRHV